MQIQGLANSAPNAMGAAHTSHARRVVQVLDDGTETNRGAVVGASASAVDGAPPRYTPGGLLQEPV